MKLNLFDKKIAITICIALIIWLTAIVFIKRITTSKYNNDELTDQKFITKLRNLENSSKVSRVQYENWLQHTQHRLTNETLFSGNVENKSLCVAVLTKKRLGTDISFISIALSSLVTRIKLKYESNVYMVVYNIDGESHDELYEFKNLIKIRNLTKPYPTIFKYLQPKVKEAQDYVEVLREMYELQCKYSLLVEDDTIAAYDWYDHIEQAIKTIDATYDDGNWLCLKLFSSYSFIDLQKLIHPYSLLRVFVYSALLVFVQILLFTSWLVSTSVNPATFGVQQFDSGFGTVAILYPHSKLYGLSEYIETVVNTYAIGASSFFQPKDLLLEQYKNSNGFLELKYEPSLFQHIGLWSTLYYYNNEVKRLFKSYTFEDNDKLIEFKEEYVA